MPTSGQLQRLAVRKWLERRYVVQWSEEMPDRNDLGTLLQGDYLEVVASEKDYQRYPWKIRTHLGHGVTIYVAISVGSGLRAGWARSGKHDYLFPALPFASAYYRLRARPGGRATGSTSAAGLLDVRQSLATDPFASGRHRRIARCSRTAVP